MSANPRYSIRSVTGIPALAAIACLVLSGCSTMQSMTSGLSTASINPVNWVTPYKVEVVQGNFLSREQVEVLKPGMTRAQVKDALGTPLLASVFHEDRWDYIFTLKRRNVAPQSYKYAVFFKGDLLDRFEGDAMPSEAEFIATLDSGRKLGKVPPLEATEAQLKAAEKPSASATPATRTAASTPAPATPTVYPPLESPKR